MQLCGTITVPLSATEPLYVAARFASRGTGVITLTTTCASSQVVDLSLLNVALSWSTSASGIYELSAAEPVRNGFPHWIKQNVGTTKGVNICHIYFLASPVKWVFSCGPRGLEESIHYSAFPSLVSSGILGKSSFSDGHSASIVPACPIGSYAQGSGFLTTCQACGAYQFSPPGATASSACACAPGAGIVSLNPPVCSPCTGDTYRPSTAANEPCQACILGSFSLDGARASAGCAMPACDQITL